MPSPAACVEKLRRRSCIRQYGNAFARRGYKACVERFFAAGPAAERALSAPKMRSRGVPSFVRRRAREPISAKIALACSEGE